MTARAGRSLSISPALALSASVTVLIGAGGSSATAGPRAAASLVTIAALGDSYSSGEGTFVYDPGTDALADIGPAAALRRGA